MKNSQRKVLFSTHLKPSLSFGQMLKHRNNVSESDKANLLAQRQILGKEVLFFKDGSRRVIGEDINADEAFDSELLRLTHASLLINEPVGSKTFCYVDATVDPVYVIIYGLEASNFINKVKTNIRFDDFFNQTIGKTAGVIKNGCDV